MKSRNRGVILSYLNTALNMVCGFFLSLFLVKVLGATEYGLYQMVTSFVNYLVLLEFGTGTAMTRNLCKCRAQNLDKTEIQKNISTIWSITIILTVIIAMISIIFYQQIGRIYYNLSDSQIMYAQKMLVFEVIYLIASFLLNTLNGIVLGFEEYKIGPIISIIRLLIRTTLLVCIISFFRYAIVIAIVRSYILMFTTIANVILTVIWIDIWGVIGACMATAVCTLIGQITLMNVYYVKKLHIKVMVLYYKTFKGILIPQLIAAGIAFVLGNRIKNQIFSFMFSVFCYICIFGYIFIKYGMQNNEKQKLILIKNGIKKFRI